MLSDDIIGGIRAIGQGIGRVIGGVFKGAVIFGSVAAVAALVAPALPSVLGYIFTTIGFKGLGASALASFASAAEGAAWSWIVQAAAAGAMLLGVTSIIPGREEGLGIKKMVTKVVQAPVQIVGKALEPQRAPEQENPYYKDGMGAASAAKGNSRESALAKA